MVLLLLLWMCDRYPKIEPLALGSRKSLASLIERLLQATGEDRRVTGDRDQQMGSPSHERSHCMNRGIIMQQKEPVLYGNATYPG